MALQIFLAVLLLVTPSLCRYTFHELLPNGDRIQHPCKANFTWKAVGHVRPDGGERNPFGIDFEHAENKWTQALCRMDSDGDGRTNGEELGDPRCIWTPGSVPERVNIITHPGMCNPHGEGVCAGRDMDLECDKDFEEYCPVIKNPDVKFMDFRITEVEVPAKETTYYCQYFNLPTDRDYHVVADTTLVDNREMAHHLRIYGCPEDYTETPNHYLPHMCSATSDSDKCNMLMSMWYVGYRGKCNGEKLGFKIGATGIKRIKLEIHYTNWKKMAGQTDESGLRLYFQPSKPWVQNLATFTLGQTRLSIPPGQSRVNFEGSCPGDCTKMLVKKPVYIVNTMNHMHLIGTSQLTQILRNGKVVKVLADDRHALYNKPVLHSYEEHFQLLPGDEISTKCTYNSMSKKTWVYGGDSSADEMCYAFIFLYPYEALPHSKWCTAHGPLSFCDKLNKTPKYGCDWSRFSNLSYPEMMEHYNSVDTNCNLDGFCRPECKEVTQGIKRHACMGPEMKGVVTSFLETYHEGTKFLGKLHSCDGVPDDKDCTKECQNIVCPKGQEGQGQQGIYNVHPDQNGDGDWQPDSGAITYTGALLMTAFFACMANLLP